MNNTKYTVGGLFSGVGGIEKAFQDAKFDILWSIESDPHCCRTYRLNFPSHNLIENDVSDTANYFNKPIKHKINKVDVLVAGFPCQAFSIAGYRKGFSDDRGNLFFAITKFIDQIKPKAILLENVKNLETHNKGETFRTIKYELEKRGYTVLHKIMNTCDYTAIPQNRERIFIIGFRDKKNSDAFKFPKKVSKEKRKLIKDFFEAEAQVDTSFYKQYDKTFYEAKKLHAGIKLKDTLYQWRRVDVRENKNNMCPALTANMGTGGHNVPLRLVKVKKGIKIIRKLTPRECFSFQGFKNIKIPKNISNAQLYKQAGNSVTIPLVTKIAKSIKKALATSRKS